MNQNCQKLKDKFYAGSKHPYQIYAETIERVLKKDCVVVDIGCGYEAPDLSKIGRFGLTEMLIGLDLVAFKKPENDSIMLVNNSASDICLHDESVDIVISRSVLEHLIDPEKVFKEVSRVLKSKGHFVFLTPNRYDYSSIVAELIPNRFHSRIVSKTEGREVDDVFPTYFRANSYESIQKFAAKSGLRVVGFDYLGQYPAYFAFNSLLFLMGTLYDKLICQYEFLRQLRGWILAVLEKS